MKLNIGRRVRAAKAAVDLGRAETADERAEREDLERRREAAAKFDALVKRSPHGWFPDDGNGSNWIPSFFRAGRDE